MAHKKLKDIIDGKSLLIIGNASNILNKNIIGIQDNYDIIVRFNDYKFNDKLGYKCDIWVYGMDDSNRILKSYSNKKIKPHYCVRYGDNIIPKDINPLLLDKKEIYDNIVHDLKLDDKIPSTGIAFLYYVVNYNCEISLIGFNGFKDRLNLNKLHKWHDGDKEFKYIKKLSNNGRIKILEL